MIKRNTIFLLLLLALASLGMVNSSGDTGFKFSHKLHIQDVGSGCSDCHAVADTSKSPLDLLLPDKAACNQCHDDTLTFTSYDNQKDAAKTRPWLTHYIARFPHQIHLANDIQCIDCHTGIDNSENISDSHLPAMSSCVQCHSSLDEPDYCYTCHSPQDDRLPADHKSDWTATHGINSYTDKDNCRMCHSDNYCLECHRGDNLDRQVHPLNFVNNHAIAAKGGNDKCYICHEEQAFCQECHRAELVLPQSHSFAGWSNKSNGGTHKTAAQFDLDGCISCHNDMNGDPICAECHTAK